MTRHVPELRCPECRGGAMREESHGDVVVDRCTCGALWCDGRELDEYEEQLAYSVKLQLERSRREPLHGPPLRCPRCDTNTLLPVTAYGLAFATCERCHGHFLTAAQHAQWDRERERRSRAGESVAGDVAYFFLQLLGGLQW